MIVENTTQVPMRRVMVATPCYDGKITAYHASSLAETCKLGMAHNINVLPFYLCFDALVQRARNDIIQVAVDANVDDLVFIDADIDWNPQDLLLLLKHDVAIVAAPAIKKNDQEQYSVKLLGNFTIGENGLAVVDGVATGFMRIRKDALTRIYENSPEYSEVGKPRNGRMVFDVGIINGALYSEDMVFCHKMQQLGYKIYIDPTINVGHMGNKRWLGNFLNHMQTSHEISR